MRAFLHALLILLYAGCAFAGDSVQTASVRTYSSQSPAQIGSGPHAFGPGSVSTKCPYGYALPDGCSEAPSASAYTVQHKDFFTGYAAQSVGAPGSSQPVGGVYPSRPQWNVAGVDYPVGIPADKAVALKVPGKDLLPNHCTASITPPGTSVDVVVCQQDNNDGFTFDGWDFSVNGGIYLTSSYLVTGPVKIRNSKFGYGATFAPGGAYGDVAHMINISEAGSLLFENNYVDANGPQSALDGSTIIETIGTDKFPATYRYNVFLRSRARVIASSGYWAAQEPVLIEKNYFEGLTYASGEAHGELTIFTWAGTMASYIARYNVFLLPNTTFMDMTMCGADPCTNGITGTFTPSLSMPDSTLTIFIMDHEVHVNNYAKVGGAFVPKETSGSVGAELQMAKFVNVTLTNNWLDPTAAWHCFYTSGMDVVGDMTSGGNVNLLTGGPANGFSVNGKGFSGTASLSSGVLNIVTMNSGGVTYGSRINVGGNTVTVVARGTGTGGLGTYIVDNTTLNYPLGDFTQWNDQCTSP